MRPKKMQSQDGFSIIDAMMATVILVVGFMGMILAVTVGSELLATAQRQALANQIISNEIEKLNLTPWSTTSGTDIVTLPAGPTSVAISGRFTAAINASGATNWTMSRSVTTVFQTGGGTPLLRAVTFTVTWTKTGNTATAATLTGSALDKLAFMRDSPISRTYTRIGTAFYGSQGINQTAQRL